MDSPPVSEDPKSQKLQYKWCSVGVLDYDKEKKLYLVHKTAEDGLVRDDTGKPILNGGVTPEGTRSLPLPQQTPSSGPAWPVTEASPCPGHNQLRPELPLAPLSCGWLSPNQ